MSLLFELKQGSAFEKPSCERPYDYAEGGLHLLMEREAPLR